jgi:hypothetical protein
MASGEHAVRGEGPIAVAGSQLACSEESLEQPSLVAFRLPTGRANYRWKAVETPPVVV